MNAYAFGRKLDHHLTNRSDEEALEIEREELDARWDSECDAWTPEALGLVLADFLGPDGLSDRLADLTRNLDNDAYERVLDKLRALS